MVKQHQEEIKEERDVFFKSLNSSINRVINEKLHITKRQDGAVENQSTKPTTIDASEISSNDLGDSKFDESDNQQIYEQSLCLKQASDNECTVEFNGRLVNSEEV